MVEETKCEFCEKEFRRHSTLLVHMCEPKRRHLQQNDPAVQLGFQAYLKFYEICQGSSKLKTSADFIKSPYYGAFVKFGRYMRNTKVISPQQFILWVIKEGKKVDHWAKDETYEEFLKYYIGNEAAEDALVRFIKLTDTWAEETKKDISQYFVEEQTNIILMLITQGRISSWVLYNCASGVKFLESLNEEQLKMIYIWIDPDFWKKKLKDYFADTEYTKKILEDAGF